MPNNTEQWTQLLQFVTSTLQQGKDFTLEQAPLFVQEYLKWEFWTAILWIAVAVIALVLVWIFADTLDKMVNGGEGEAKKTIRAIAVAFALVIISANTFTAVKVKVAPRLVLIDGVQSLLGSNRR